MRHISSVVKSGLNLYRRARLGFAAILLAAPGGLPILSSQAGCVPPPAGIVAWWTGEGVFSDLVGTNNGVPTNNVTFAAGEVGQAFGFDGTDSAVILANSTNLQLQTFTIEAWIKRASPTLASHSSYNAGAILEYNWGGYGFDLANDGRLFLTKVGVSAVYSSFALTDTLQFHHVAVTKSGSNVVFYLDGVANSVAPYDPGFTFSDPVCIGAATANLYACFLGWIDEVSVYNRALTGSEVASIYIAGSAGKCRTGIGAPAITSQPSSLVALWGQPVTFSVEAAGALPLNYQWYKDGLVLAGATNASLVFASADTNSVGSYAVTVANSYGIAASSPALLSVNAAGVTVGLYAGITVQGTLGKVMGVQYSTNINRPDTWVGLTNLTLIQTNLFWLDPLPVNQSDRFYRVVPGPISIP